MVARIYKPAKTAMQSGTAKTKEWVLDYEPEEPREIEPLMGWTSSGDMRSRCGCASRRAEEAVAYAERHGIPIRCSRPSRRRRRADGLFRQFRLQAPRRLDPLSRTRCVSRRVQPLPRRPGAGGPGRRRAGAAAR